jgi:hypothetical protein
MLSFCSWWAALTNSYYSKSLVNDSEQAFIEGELKK